MKTDDIKLRSMLSHSLAFLIILSAQHEGTESVSLSELSQSHVPMESELDPGSSLPSFVSSNNNTLVTSVGQTVYLYCGVHNLGDRQCRKHRNDNIILVAGDMAQIKRFNYLDNWTCQIVNPNLNDSGLYECQISYHDDTEKKLKMPFNLQVLESHAQIIGSEDLYIHEGSPVSLQCIVVDSAGPPAYIYWYKGKEVINYSNQKHIEITYSDLETSPVSTLVIKQATPSDSGNYTCAPANYRQHSVIVNVIKGEKQAGLQEIANFAKTFHWTAMSQVLIVCTMAMLVSGTLSVQ